MRALILRHVHRRWRITPDRWIPLAAMAALYAWALYGLAKEGSL
jgi:hypothetical protein